MDRRGKTAGSAKTQFKKGNTASKGRAGIKNKLSRSFLEAVYADWQKDGAKALVEMRTNDPSAYIRMVATLIPREMSKYDTKHDYADLSDDELMRLVKDKTQEMSKLFENDADVIELAPRREHEK